MGDPSLFRGAAKIVRSKARACDSTPAREGHTPSAPSAPSVLMRALSRLVAGRPSKMFRVDAGALRLTTDRAAVFLGRRSKG